MSAILPNVFNSNTVNALYIAKTCVLINAYSNHVIGTWTTWEHWPRLANRIILRTIERHITDKCNSRMRGGVPCQSTYGVTPFKYISSRDLTGHFRDDYEQLLHFQSLCFLELNRDCLQMLERSESSFYTLVHLACRQELCAVGTNIVCKRLYVVSEQLTALRYATAFYFVIRD